MPPAATFETFSTKSQPWKKVWPAPPEMSDKSRGFGFKKGDLMVFDGNAGNFFPHGEWELEQQSTILPSEPKKA